MHRLGPYDKVPFLEQGISDEVLHIRFNFCCFHFWNHECDLSVTGTLKKVALYCIYSLVYDVSLFGGIQHNLRGL